MLEILSGTNNTNYEIYVLSYNNEMRRNHMIRRFKEVNVNANIYNFRTNDARASNNTPSCCFWNHLRMIEDFYHSNKEFGVFLENDVYLKKTFKLDLENACKNMTILNLDVLLIGYLLNTSPETYFGGLKYLHTDQGKYYDYEYHLYGAQGYILTKPQAKYFIEKYTVDYVNHTNETISADWIFTKQGNKALIYPPLVVEEGNISSTDINHMRFHQSCKLFLYNDNHFIINHFIYNEMIVGKHTYGQQYITIQTWSTDDGSLTIGNFCSIAGNVIVQLGGNHYMNWVSTFPFPAFSWGVDQLKPSWSKGNVVIGNDVWIGFNATILSGVTIGDGAIIGANTTVTKNVPPYAVCVGNPGVVKKYRFTDHQIADLLKIKWWDWSDDKIKSNMSLMCSDRIDDFINKHKL